MKLHQISKFVNFPPQSRREIAHFGHCGLVPYSVDSELCNVDLLEQGLSIPWTPYCQHCYPSPSRFINSFGKPVRGTVRFASKAATTRYMQNPALEVAALSSDSFNNEINWESTKTCAKTHSSFWQSQHLDCQVASNSTTMRSAHWLARAQVALQAKFLTTIVPLVRLSVGLPAHWPTTSNVYTCAAKQARIDLMENAAGASLRSAFLRLKDYSNV